MSDKMRQDGAKMRKMEDVSSVSGTLGGHEELQGTNNFAGRGAGEVPPLERVNPSPRPVQNGPPTPQRAGALGRSPP